MRELSRREAVGLGALGLLAAACGTQETPTRAGGHARRVDPAGAKGATPTQAGSPDVAVDPPASLKGAAVLQRRPGLRPEHPGQGDRRADPPIKGVNGVEVMSMGQFYVDEREVTYAAVDPATFWRYTQPGTAQTMAVWKRVADGEIAVEPAIGKRLQRATAT